MRKNFVPLLIIAVVVLTIGCRGPFDIDAKKDAGVPGGTQGGDDIQLTNETPSSIYINDFSLIPETIHPGEMVTIRWDVSDIDYLEIAPIVGKVNVSGGRSADSVQITTISETTTFTLIAKKGTDEILIKRAVSVVTGGDEPAITELSCPLKVLPKQPFDILYETGNAEEILLIEGPSQKPLDGAAGDIPKTITGNTTFTLYVSNPTGHKSASCTVMIRDALCMFQKDCNSSSGVPGGLSYPDGVSTCSKDGPLVVSDWYNNRILIWNQIPQSDGELADVVLGQPNLSTHYPSECRFGTLTPSNFSRPVGVFCDGTRLLVADWDNHRVLFWNHIPTRNNEPADRILGQENGHSCGADYFYKPSYMYVLGNQLFVSDVNRYDDNWGPWWGRLLIWNNYPDGIKTGGRADVIVRTFPQGWGTAHLGTNNLVDWHKMGNISSYGDYLILADNHSRRVVFLKLKKSDGSLRTTQADWDGMTADDVFCFPNPDCRPSALEPVGATTLKFPTHAFVADLKVEGNDGPMPYLLVSDFKFYRVTAYPIDSENFGNADAENRGIISDEPSKIVLIGRETFSEVELNPYGNYRMIDPNSIVPFGDGGLVITSRGCNRAVIFNPADGPFIAGETAGRQQISPSVVLGHESKDGCGRNMHGVGITTSDIQTAVSVAYDGRRYYFPDGSRVLVYDGLPLSSKQDAIGVIGQADFASNLANRDNMYAPPTAKTLNFAYGIEATRDKLFVTDVYNNRILIYDLTNFQPFDMAASWVIGQPNFEGMAENYGGSTPAETAGCAAPYWRPEADCPNRLNLFHPTNVHFDGTYIYVNDGANNRILVFEAAEVFERRHTPPEAKAVIGQDKFTSNTPRVRGIGFGYGPYGLTSGSGRLFAADLAGDNVYVYSDIHNKVQNWTEGQLITPDIVLHQINEIGDDGRVTRSHLDLLNVQDVAAYDGLLYVADRDNSRVLIYKIDDLKNNAMPSYVFGQWDGDGNPVLDTGITGSSRAGGVALDHTSISSATGIDVWAGFMFIADNTQKRYLVLPVNTVLEYGRLK